MTSTTLSPDLDELVNGSGELKCAEKKCVALAAWLVTGFGCSHQDDVQPLCESHKRLVECCEPTEFECTICGAPITHFEFRPI